MGDERHWDEIGLLDGLDAPGRAARVALLQRLDECGVDESEMVRASARGDLPLVLADRIVGGEGRWTGQELVDRSGIDQALLRRIRQVSGLPEIDLQERVYSDVELESSRLVREFLDLGIDQEVVVQVSRVMGRTLGALAETTRDALFTDILEQDLSELELADRLCEVATATVPLFSAALNQVARIHLRNAMANELVTHVGARMPGTRNAVFAFADLVGFTRMGEELPPEELGRVAEQLVEIVQELVTPPVRMVKTIGDAVMLTSPDPAALIDFGLRLCARVEERGPETPQLRVGIASGPVVARAGDVFGGPVNVASRVTGVARAGSVLTTAPVREAAGDQFVWSLAGVRRLKGLPRPLSLFRARQLGHVRPSAE